MAQNRVWVLEYDGFMRLLMQWEEIMVKTTMSFNSSLPNSSYIVEPLNEVAGDRVNLFVKSRGRYIENLTNLRETTKMFVIWRYS